MKTKKLFFIAVMIIAAITFSSCKKSLQDIIEETEKATFIVYTYDEYGSPMGSGSGFFIEKEGVGMTNFHVLDKSIKAIIKTTDEKQYEIDSVLLASQKKDMLIFKIKNKDHVEFSTLDFAADKPEKGDKVFVIGAPVGMATSLSEGIVSAYRDDSHGEIVQTTAAISPGSSGSPILNDKGDVFAIASFKRKGGENVNFGVMLNKDFRSELDEKEFYKKNRKFNSSKSDFVLLNILPDKGSDLTLNAIEFGPTATTLYLTYTNMHLGSGNWLVWCDLGNKDEGFFIEDKDTKKRYYATSSSIGTDKESGASVGLGEVLQFKVNFPAIKTHLSNIDVMWGESDRDAHYSDIDLEKYRENLSIDDLSYQRAYALLYTTEGKNVAATMSILSDILEENPSDVISLNMMAILSYIIDNKTDAMIYLEDAIEENPNDELAYLNRAQMYMWENRYDEAITDFTSAINISPLQPDYYYYRAISYNYTKQYQKSLDDLNKCIEVSNDEDGYEDSPYLYEWRAHAYYNLNKINEARKDVQKAFKLSNDSELDERLQNFYNYCL